MTEFVPTKEFRPLAAFNRAIQFVFQNIPHLAATSALTLFVVAGFNVIYTFLTYDSLVQMQQDIVDAMMNENYEFMLQAMVN